MFVRKSFGLIAICLLSSCGKEPKNEETGGDSTPVDTVDTDSGEIKNKGTPLVVQLDADALDGLSTFALTWVDLNSLESSEVLFAEKNTQGSIVEREQEFFLRDPLEEELQVLDAESGLAVAAYVGSIQREDSGTTTYFGVADQWVVYSNMEMAPFGINEGWNFFSPVTETFSAFSNLTMSSNLAPVDVLSIGGNYQEYTAIERRLVFLAINAEGGLGANELEPIWDSTIDPQWTCAFDEPPPEDHFYLGEDNKLQIAGEVPFTYADLSGNETFDLDTDVLEYGACVGQTAVAAMFFKGLDDLGTALGFQMAGLRPGWTLMKLWAPEGESPFVDSSDYLDLQIGKHCLFVEPEPSAAN